MSKTVKLLLAGVLPLVVGIILNYMLIYLPISGIILLLIGLALAVL